MKIEFITNTCFLVELSDGKKLLTDPWMSDGVYYGSWYNFPPIAEKKKYLECNPDYIYVSHIHPDHFDPETLKHFPKSTEIWIGKFPQPHLEKQIRALGFSNIQVFPFEQPTKHKNYTVTIFGDFSGSSLGHKNEVDYAMDSSLLIKDADGTTLFDINDNTIQESDAKTIVEKFGSPDVSIVPCSGASSYPHAFDIYSPEKKKELCLALTDRMCARFVKVAKILNSKWTIPAAGAHVIGGRSASFSEYLHQPTSTHLLKYCQEAGLNTENMIYMFEGDLLDTASKQLKLNTKAPFRNFSAKDRADYALTLSDKKLTHELVEIPSPFTVNFSLLLPKARQNLWAYQQKHQLFPDWDIEIVGRNSGIRFRFPLNHADISQNNLKVLSYSIDERLLLMVLIRAAHWNNIEIGSLVTISRSPDEFVLTLPNLMSYFVL